MAIEVRFGVFKDPWSATTHFVGFLGALVGCGAILMAGWADPVRLVAGAIYGVALVVLFLASSLYHFFDFGPRANHWLRRVDHAAIFVFIAACYVPISALLLDGAWQLVLLTGISALGVGGALYKLIWFHAPMWVEMTGYLGLGWLGVLLTPAILAGAGGASVVLMAGGGLAYTLGAVVFILERPDPWPKIFGHHEIWHLFVLAGATAHYFMLYGVVSTA
ncbi:MAG: hemolysin III family protein [Alphaproteobacteria bacterium]|nr:hemolysin III family protein [Alphaproteobacteria bacterium]